MRRLLCILGLLVLAAPAGGDERPRSSGVAATSSASLPGEREFTRIVLDLVKSYPADGTHRYHWPKGSSWEGTTRDLVYGGVKVATGDPEKRCYCCGLTFEVFFRAWETWCAKKGRPFRILDLDAPGVTRLRREWFGPTAKDRRTLEKAITQFGLGRAISVAEARAGDFCQLWRRDGSGHSVVLLEVVKEGGKPAALRYWSTQKSTNGIGERTEKFSSTGVILEETYFARVGRETWR